MANDVAITRVPIANTAGDLWIGARGYNSRFVPAATLRGFPTDQMSGGMVYLKERIADFSCGCYDEDGAGPCKRCMKLLPVYRFPQLETTAIPSGCALLGGHKLDVRTRTGAVPASVQNALRKELRSSAKNCVAPQRTA